MVIRRTVSAAVQTATDMTGVDKSGLVQGGRNAGPARDVNRAGSAFQLEKSILVTGEYMTFRHAIRFVLSGFFLCAMALPARQAAGRALRKQASGDPATSAGSKKDACGLLSAVEIEAVQGEPVNETKASVQPNGEMQLSECLFHTAKPAKSVSVALAVPSSTNPSGLTPRKFWHKQFHASETKRGELRGAGKRALKPESEGEEGAREPRRIAGLGDDAYWVGTPIAGALYVLQGDNFVRISVGGVGDESTRIEKSKALARAAVKCL